MKIPNSPSPFSILIPCGLILLTMLGGIAQGAPSGTAFTYQGRLTDGGSPATGSYDLKFALFDASTAGTLVGTPTTITLAPVGVSNGLFTVTLDFGGAAFAGSARWLEIAVRTNGSVSAHTILSPRQPLTPAPYALFAATAATAATATDVPWSALTSLPSGFADGIDNDTTYSAGTGLTLSGATFSIAPLGVTASMLADGSVNTNKLSTAGATAGQVLRFDGLRWSFGTDSNTTYTAGTGLTLSGGSFSVNFGGSGASSMASRSDHAHAATDITSGLLDDARFPTNIARLTGEQIFTGLKTFAPLFSPPFAVLNPVKVDNLNADYLDDLNATDFWKTAGNSGTAPGTHFLGTTDSQALEFKVNNARALRLEPNITCPNVIAGHAVNSVDAGVAGATISGGGQSGGAANRITGDFGVVGGGFNNTAGTIATVAGGVASDATGIRSTVGGGFFNVASGFASTIAGGNVNDALGAFSSVAGGQDNLAQSDFASIGGGLENRAGFGATVGGGTNNIALGDLAFIGGGAVNTNKGLFGTIGGGAENVVSNDVATVAGGADNVAGGFGASVGGGYGNKATGLYSTVPGGFRNTASGTESFAAGTQAKAIHNNTFVWAADDLLGGTDFTSTGPSQFLIRSPGGVGINTASPVKALDVRDGFGEGGAIHVGGTGANGDAKLINFGDGDFVHIGENGADDRMELKASTFFFTGGRVGIGTSTPGYMLHVNGSVAGVGPYNDASDARFKTNVLVLTNALEKVLRLRGVSYNWRHEAYAQRNFNRGRQIGFIAQELQELLPEVVSQDAEGYYAIAYSHIVPVLVEAIKEQQGRFERALRERDRELTELQRQVAAQKVEQQKWEARFVALEKNLAARNSITDGTAVALRPLAEEQP